jgi:hypothetical protein
VQEGVRHFDIAVMGLNYIDAVGSKYYTSLADVRFFNQIRKQPQGLFVIWCVSVCSKLYFI